MTASPIEDAVAAPPVLITVRRAPRREPPFDDELPANVIPLSRYDRPLPFEDNAAPPRPVAIRAVPDPDLPEPARWASTILIGLVETANGRRPPQQLGQLFTPLISARISADLTARVANRRHWLHAATIRSIRAMQPRPGVAEVSATLAVGSRVRAIALRMERHHDQWRCTKLQLG